MKRSVPLPKKVLQALRQQTDPMTLSQLAEATGHSISGVRKAIAELELLGYVYLPGWASNGTGLWAVGPAPKGYEKPVRPVGNYVEPLKVPDFPTMPGKLPKPKSIRLEEGKRAFTMFANGTNPWDGTQYMYPVLHVEKPRIRGR